jgi:simple sugar transport system ATP-binding protein
LLSSDHARQQAANELRDLPESGEPATGDVVLRAAGIRKSFGHVRALWGADFECRRGEVTALVGDNGAGKSTLVKILSGALKPDEGTLYIEGGARSLDSPMAAHQAGIETVYQDLSLAPDLSPTANLFLGREILKPGWRRLFGVLDERAMRDVTGRRFAELGVKLDITAGQVRNLSGGQRQGVAVARAVAWAERVVILDEPTAALGVVQTERVLELVRGVADSGLAVVLVSHSMPDVLKVSDRIEVLRLGERVARFVTKQTRMADVVAAMTGADYAKGERSYG